MEITTNSNI